MTRVTATIIDENGRAQIFRGQMLEMKLERDIPTINSRFAAMATRATIRQIRMFEDMESFELPANTPMPYETSATTNQKEIKAMKTMYDTHTDRDGNSAPIFCLADTHIQNMITYKVHRFIAMRDSTSSVKSNDPMIQAMHAKVKWDAKELEGRTKSVLNELNPFIQEALVRGGSTMEAACDAMRRLTGRTGRIMPPSNTISVDESDWDRIADGNLLESEQLP